jgi:hypothetical protein
MGIQKLQLNQVCKGCFVTRCALAQSLERRCRKEAKGCFWTQAARGTGDPTANFSLVFRIPHEGEN